MSPLRVFLAGGLLSYRSLFNWRHPTVYVPILLGTPLFQMLFFVHLGRYSDTADDRFFLVGNAVHGIATACVFGMVMALGNERQLGTLSAVLATPANRVALFCGRIVPHVVNGVVAFTFCYAAGSVLLGLGTPGAALPSIAGTIALTAVSCAMFGLALGAISMRTKDIWTGSNAAHLTMLLVCGVNVPLGDLPGWLATLGQALPLTHGIEAVRRLASGADVTDVTGLIGGEALVAAGYAVLGYALIRLFELESRLRATMDTL